MEAPSPQYILTRAAYLLVTLVVGLIGYKIVRKHQREAAIIAELQTITSDSAFFQQFYAEDARKSLVRAIGLIAEAASLDVAPADAINRGLGIKPRFFADETRHEEPPVRERIIRSCLRDNYVNFTKLGFKPDFYTLDAMRKGQLPPIPSGPQSGRTPVICYIISPAISPGMDKVIANLEIRPPAADEEVAGDIQIANAKQLARDLTEARIIEDHACEKILEALSQKPAAK
ncbi:MAG: hypothetical protein WCK77_16550 [Verrucomicrobiota bacterium]